MAAQRQRQRTSAAELFDAQFRSMVRLAALLGSDDPEDVAQEAFTRLHVRHPMLREPHAALAYVRRTVVNLCHSRHRRLGVIRRHSSRGSDAESAESAVLRAEAASDVVRAVAALPARQREVVVLRYWLDLSEAEIADAMGVSVGTVKSQASRALAKLGTQLEGPQQ